MRSERHVLTPEDGFTLVEVLVALVMVGVVATAALGLLVRGVDGSASISERQEAVMVANQVMEQVHAVNPAVNDAGTSRLVTGRYATDVATQWSASSAPAKAITWQDSDPSATSTSDPTLPLHPTSVVLGGRTYDISTLIGTCYRLRSNTSGPCTLDGTATGAPGTEPTTSTTLVPMQRVIVEVSWTPASAGSCAAATCFFRESSLIDAHVDTTWNANGALAATDDTFTVAKGSSTSLSVLSNDTGSLAATSPVTITKAATKGTATASSTGMVTYAAPATGGTTATFQYTITSSTGAVSNTATVTIAVSS